MESKKYHKKPIIVRCAADLLLPLAAVYGAYIVFHGNSSPGGGFQGGVLIASVVLLVYLAYGVSGVKKAFNSHAMHVSETIAEIIYIGVAVLGVVLGLNFCYNFIFAGGQLETTMIMNDAVGYHVMGGIIGLLILMLTATGGDEEEGKEVEEKA